MVKKISIGVSVVVAGILLFAGVKSGEMKVSRDIIVAVSPETLFPYINNSRKSYEWMPWAESDPTVAIEFAGPEEGVGSKSRWTGKEMGVGISEIIESLPNQVVKTKLEYTKPFAFSQLAEVSLSPTESGTRVTWSVSGHSNYFFRLVSIFVNCDAMIGGEFEKGLSKLKTIAESN